MPGARSVPAMECHVGAALQRCAASRGWASAPACVGRVLWDCGGTCWRNNFVLRTDASYCRSVDAHASAASVAHAHGSPEAACIGLLCAATRQDRQPDDPDDGRQDDGFPWIWIGLLVLVVAAIVAVVIFRRLRNRPSGFMVPRRIGSVRHARNSIDLTHHRSSLTSLQIEGGSHVDPFGKRHYDSSPGMPDSWASFGDLASEDDESLTDWDVPVILTKPLEHPLKSALKVSSERGMSPSSTEALGDRSMFPSSTEVGGSPSSVRELGSMAVPAPSAANRNTVHSIHSRAASNNFAPAMSTGRLAREKSNKSVKTRSTWWSMGSFAPPPTKIVFDDAPAEVITYEPQDQDQPPPYRGSEVSDIEADWEAIQARFAAWSANVLDDDDVHSHGGVSGRSSNASSHVVATSSNTSGGPPGRVVQRVF